MWKVGDVAIRRSFGPWSTSKGFIEGPEPGSFNKVVEIVKEGELIGLKFEKFETTIFESSVFERLEAADEQFVSMIKNKKGIN